MRPAWIAVFAALLPAAACVAQNSPAIDPADLAEDRRRGEALSQEAEKDRRQWSRASEGRRRSALKDLGSLKDQRRRRALDAIAAGGPAFTPLLTEALSSRNGYQVRYALAALGGLRDPAAAPALRAFLKRDDITPADRFYALGALAPIAPAAAADELWPLALGQDPRLARAAERALIQALGSGYGAALLERRAAAPQAVDQALTRYAAQEGAAGEAAGWARSATPSPPPELRVIYGQGYRCFTDLEEEEARRLAIDLVRARDALQLWLAPRDRSRLVTTLRLFRQRRDFERYGAAREYNFIHFSGYYYSSLLREVVAFRRPRAAQQARGLRHEAGHDAIEQLIGRPPPWFGEGLSEMLELGSLKEGETPPVNSEWLPILRGALADQSLPKLDELLALTNADYYADDSQRRYAASWSFCHFLIAVHGKRGLGLLRKVFRKAAAGPEKALDAFRGWASPDKLTPGWIAHIKSLR